METIGESKFGGIIKGNLGGIIGNVIFKAKNTCQADGINEKLQKEADVYEKLKDLQGKFIPTLYAFVDFCHELIYYNRDLR